MSLALTDFTSDTIAPACEPGAGLWEASSLSFCRGLLKWPLLLLLPLDGSGDRSGSLGTFGRLKEPAFHQESFVVLLSWCKGFWYDERAQGRQFARDLAGIVNKQVKVSWLEPQLPLGFWLSSVHQGGGALAKTVGVFGFSVPPFQATLNAFQLSSFSGRGD